MQHFWTGFDKCANAFTSVEHAAEKAVGRTGNLRINLPKKEPSIDYRALNKPKAPAAAPHELNYAQMKNTAPQKPMWQQRHEQSQMRSHPPGRQDWTPEMKQRILSGNV